MVIYISSRRVLILYIQSKYVLACAGIIAFVDWDGERNAFMIALNYYYYVRRVCMKCINRMMNCTICSPVVCGELILWVIMEWCVRFQYKLHCVTWTVIQHIVRSVWYKMVIWQSFTFVTYRTIALADISITNSRIKATPF